MNLILKFILISDALFGRGEGVAGFIDAEVQHDKSGCPYLGGRTLKGLLAAECANIIFALSEQGHSTDLIERFERSRQHLFGRAGSGQGDEAFLHIGDATLPRDLRDTISFEVEEGRLDSQQILNAMTTIRRQTSINELTGAPKRHALHSRRVILRGTPFEANFTFEQPPLDLDLPLLAACVKAFRRAGTAQNRGLGALKAQLVDESGNNVMEPLFDQFKSEVLI